PALSTTRPLVLGCLLTNELLINLSRRQRTCAGKFFEQLQDLCVPRHLPDHPCQFRCSQWRWIVVHEFLEVLWELRIFKGLAHRLFENLDPVSGRSRRQDVGRADASESTPNGKNSFFPFGLGEAFYLRKVSEARMLIPFRDLHDGVKVHQSFVQPL